MNYVRKKSYHRNEICNYEIFVWLDHDATASEIREHFSQHNWSKQAVSTFLKRLTQSGYLKMKKISPTKCYYTVLISESEHNLLPVREVVRKSFNKSYGALFCALISSNTHFSDDTIEKVNKMISDLNTQSKGDTL